MSIISQDIPHLEWRAAEAGCTVDELLQFQSILTPDLDGHTSNSPDPSIPALPIPNVFPYGDTNELYPLRDTRIAFIGAGAGTIMLASYLSQRGALLPNMTIVDPMGEYGGKWQDEDVRVGGFNNPQALEFGSHRLALDNRSGHFMISYLQSIAQRYLGRGPLMGDRVSNIRPLAEGDTWLVGTESGHDVEADIVVMAAGTPKPNRIDGSRIRSNLDQYPSQTDNDSFIVERNQRELTEDELIDSAEGKTIVIMGLGNSMAAMLHQIQTYEDMNFVNLNYVIVTDRNSRAVNNPETAMDSKRSVFRDPSNAYLTGYSADLLRDRSSYFRALGEGHIKTSVTSVNYDESTRNLIIRDNDGNETCLNSPQVFALLGHGPDSSLFHQLGALVDGDKDRNDRLIRANDGAVHTRDRGYMSNVYAIGSMAATYNNRNSLVIPGINGQLKSTVLTIGVRCLAKSLRIPQTSTPFNLKDLIKRIPLGKV